MHSYSNWPKKVFAAGTEGSGVALYVPIYLAIYNTSNSLLTELMVDHDTLLGKELGPLNIL